ncbi:hypothetical protein BGW36DRAFT_382361 [Talaromyces proteolyticus]|uniref:Zn(2)-C6 fungal-type domain-containing protein n=1 Tax=Talaromyces proteolyticus TaxID=1131652 RepID=A0AAD4KPB4_9EURO|nr:uncharacterized protein BGW36DRAFT_382361 [Talaromyces proteolyticus]KAH8695243.1 hypothetical protein BGW36DRAFT_382361 [Talaromyces proteolyticus]
MGEMPGAKRKGKPRGIRRDRDCQSCKDRGIKCDLNRPRCQPCVQSGLPCGGYPQRVVWAAETVSKQRRTSESHQTPRSTSSRDSPLFSRSKSVNTVSPASPSSAAATATTSETPTPCYNPATNQYSFIKRLTEFYEQIKDAEHKSGGAYLSPEAVDLVSRIWNFVRARMQGYVTVGSPEKSSMDAVRFHVAALMGLAEAVDKAHPVALFGIATFAFFEVCEGSFGEWQRHLKGARSLLDIHCRSKTDLDRLSQDITGLTDIVAHLVWFDTMGAVIRGSRGLIFDDWHRETLRDSFFASVGCPSDAFHLFVALSKENTNLNQLDLSFEATDQLMRAESEHAVSDTVLTAGAWRCTAAIAILSRIGDGSSSSRQRALSSAVDQACRAIASITPASGIYIHLAATAYLAGINATHPQQCEVVRNYWRNCQASDFPHYPDGQARCEEKWRAEGLA